ncbi:hypothetical protein [Tamlana flava]|uniref:hypothetical protein n=1 Tax=Tamlana flava TaxID=3158572 RepID=UPI00351BA6CB
MTREFDSFIIVPEFANGQIKKYPDYLSAKVEDNPEMAFLKFNGIDATYIHDATEKEEKTIEFLEQPDSKLKYIFQNELDAINKELKINSNIFLDTINILPEENENYHLTKITFVTNDKVISIYSYGPEVNSIQ